MNIYHRSPLKICRRMHMSIRVLAACKHDSGKYVTSSARARSFDKTVQYSCARERGRRREAVSFGDVPLVLRVEATWPHVIYERRMYDNNVMCAVCDRRRCTF